MLAAVAVVMLCWPAAAADKFGIVTLELRAEQGGAPTHLCVVAAAKGSRSRTTLKALLQPLESGNKEGERNGSWLVDPKAWGGAADSVDRDRCASHDLGDCRPRVELPSGLQQRLGDLHVACIADGLLQSDQSQSERPVFVLLEHLDGSPPSIESVRLVGGVATVGVAADLERVVVTARSLGGYYLPDHVSERAETELGDGNAAGASRKHVSLALQARCRLIEVTLPATRLSVRDRDRLSVSVHGIDFDVDRCVRSLPEDAPVVQVRVPPAPLGVGSIEFELAATEAGKAAAKFGASYYGKWPRTPFPLTFKQVTFTWRRPKCIYPEASCPIASLETGTTCESTLTEEGCAYVCPGEAGEDALDLVLPLTVHFEKEDPTQKWSDRLAQNGQRLTSYVDADDIYVEADISRWNTESPANRITDIELFTEDGGTLPRGVTGVKKLQLKVPGASCEPLRFRPVGDREYRDDIATIADGQIEFGNPERMAKRLSVSMLVALGGGPAWSGPSPDASPPVYFNGIGLFALQYRPTRPGWSRIGFEGRVGLTLGRWGAVVEESTTANDTMEPDSGPEDTTTTTAEQRFSQARVLFEPGIVIAVHDRFGVGAGFGLGASFPIREAQELTQDRIQFIWSPSVDGRFYINPWIGLVLQIRGVFGERAFQVVGEMNPDPDANETSDGERTRASKARSLLALFGTVIRF
ncbi:MAG: hypothetical protein JKY37_28700 [Nannocystaceae bacterium]|nr:hypothetical protein [Nannocystaceae bacterium]